MESPRPFAAKVEENVPDRTFLNVYSGPDSLKKYFDPEKQPPLPLVEIPACLNTYRQDGVRIYAKMMSMHPANNVKVVPAMGMLSRCATQGDAPASNGTPKTIVEYSSGSTVISLSLASRIYHNIRDVRAFLSNKTSESKLRLMQFFGLDITLFGGPSQPEPSDPRGGIYEAKRLGTEKEGWVNCDQYGNDENWKSHVRITGPQIHRQLPSINVVCAGMGTSGTMTGVGTYFGQHAPSVLRLGVCTAPGDRVPGPRSHALLAPVRFPWKKAVDAIEEVGSKESFALSLELCREGLICGPSSGFNLQGLLNHLGKRKDAGRLNELRGPQGDINCVFICCDLPYQYLAEYFEKLPAENFKSIRNENLRTVDLHRYDEAWELESPCPSSFSTIVDLRRRSPLEASLLPGSMNVPLASLTTDSASPFKDAAVLEAQWLELERVLAGERQQQLRDEKVLVLCYDGDTSRVATSVLRARGVEAWSVKGGAKGWTALRGRVPQEEDRTALRVKRVDSLSPSGKGTVAMMVGVSEVEVLVE